MSGPAVNKVQICANGPLVFDAALSIAGAPAGPDAALCRCGATANKPYCDGSHATTGFTDAGEPAVKAARPLAAHDGPVNVALLPDGPLMISGNLELLSATGEVVDQGEKFWLCRCGQSKKKPYCDGAHKAAGFKG